MARKSALVFIGGEPPHHGATGVAMGALHRARGNDETVVIAADSGWSHAVATGLEVDVLIGDMDSIDPGQLRLARASSARIVEFPADKDETDTELAIAEAREIGCGSVTLISGGGDRLDHVIAMMHSLAACPLPVVAYIGAARVEFAVPGRAVDFDGRPGETVSLVPLGGDATGVTTEGLKWSLHAGDLSSAESRGVSNVITHGRVHVSVTSGTIAVMRPRHLDAGDADTGPDGMEEHR